MSMDIKDINRVFKEAYSDKMDMYMNPSRAEELKKYQIQKEIDLIKNNKLEDERNEKISKLQPLVPGKYKIKLLNEIFNYTTSLGKKGSIIKVYNKGPSQHTGSLNRNQDIRALVYDYGMSGTDNYYPTIDFEIIEYLGNE